MVPAAGLAALLAVGALLALAKKPDERYGSVKEFSDAFVAAAAKAPETSASGSASDEGDGKAGLFGKMKGLFRRS